jgi:hypothetical protein
MSAYNKLFKLAENQGITIPEVVKFLASPAGYTLSKALETIESKAQLPQGILSLAQNPVSGVTDYLKTQASNAVFNQNEPSKVESIISELQGANPDKPNYVGPQQVDSPLSQQNTTMLPSTLGVQPTDEFVHSNNMNDDLREGMFGTITPNYARFVGPQEFNSPSDQIGMQFLAEDLGVPPTQQTTGTNILDVLNAMNADGTINTDSQSFTGPQIEGSQLFENNTYDLGNSLSDYLSTTGGDGKLENFLQSQEGNAYKYGGQIYRGRR